MNYIYASIVLATSALQCQAVDLGGCAKLASMEVSFAGMTGDYAAASVPLKVVDRKVVAGQKGLVVSQDLSDKRDFYKYKVDLGAGQFETRSLEVIKNGSGYTIKRLDDNEARIAAAIRGGVSSSVANSSTLPAGRENSYSEAAGKCRIEQAIEMTRVKMGEKAVILKNVYADEPYCAKIREILSHSSREKAQGCVDTLEAAGKAFDARRAELAKEDKLFKIAPTQNDGFMSAAAKIAMCSPEQWNLRVRSGYGNFTFNGTQGDSGLGSGEDLIPQSSQGSGVQPVTKPSVK